MAARMMRGNWWCDFRWEGQRVRWKSPVNTRRGAEAYERRLRQQLLDGTLDDKEVDNDEKKMPTLAEFSDEFLKVYAATNNKPSELLAKNITFRRHLVPVFGALRLDEIDLRGVERYKASKLAEKLKPKTINNHLTVLHRMLAVAVEWGVLEHGVKMRWMKVAPPEFDFLTFDEAERIVNAASEEWRCMILLALKTGLRQGELLALRWEDVDLVTNRLVVRRNMVRGNIGTPKSGRHREVPLSSSVVKALKAERHLRGETVFSDSGGNMLTAAACVRPIWRACKRAGLRQVRWHVLRHTFASHLAMRGVPLKAIQELLGHATIEMTMRYAHLAPAVHREAIAQLDLPAPDGHQVGTEARN